MKKNLKKTIEELDGDVWDEPEIDSYLVITCHRLRKKPIGKFTIEDLRIMIGQGVGAQYLVPRVLDELDANPFAEGDFYPGDLLEALTRLPDDYWWDHGEHYRRALSAASRVLEQLKTLAEEDLYPSHKSLIHSIQRFQQQQLRS